MPGYGKECIYFSSQRSSFIILETGHHFLLVSLVRFARMSVFFSHTHVWMSDRLAFCFSWVSCLFVARLRISESFDSGQLSINSISCILFRDLRLKKKNLHQPNHIASNITKDSLIQTMPLLDPYFP